MKSILSALLSIGAFAVLAGSTFIPRANDRTLAVSPLAPGETAFVPEPDGAALYVGGDAGNLLVGDPNALRSYTYEEIPRTDFSIGASTGIVYVASNDQWRVAGSAIATESVLIAFPIGLEPSHVEMDKVVVQHMTDPTPPGEIVVHPISNGVIRVDLKRTKACSEDLYVANIRAYRLVGGAEGHVNDALSSVWLIRDSLGVFDLGDLRHEMAHKYDGNRGEDWSAYAAREDVRLDGYGLRFDPKSRYQQYVDTETNLVLQAGGIDAISVRFEGANLDPTVFAITEFTRSTNGGSFVAWTCDIDGATADDFDVIWASKLNQSEWTSFTDAECEITHNELTDEWNAWIPGRDADAEFYRINYHGVVSEVLQVTLRGEVTIPDVLLLGTGTDAVNVAAALSSKLTGIDVNGERAPVTNGVAYIRVSGGGGTDGEAVTNIVRSLAYERDDANAIISNRWTQTAERGVLPTYSATGATVGAVGYDALLTYTESGTLTIPAPTRVRILAIGGGGGGAGGGSYFGRTQTGGAGGGAGGLVETNVTLAAGTYEFTVGAGGAGGEILGAGNSGGATTISCGGAVIATVPGGGAGGNYAQSGAAGGCGGGAGGTNAGDPACVGGAGDPGEDGGASAGGNCPGSGGGGMGTEGGGATTTAAGHGGDGIASDITGETVHYAGGGGGGSALGGIAGAAGGLGGGGTGATGGTEPAQKAGVDGLGGGGGGGGLGAQVAAYGGAGGRGVVIVRIEHTGVVTNTVPYALVTDIPTAAEWQALKARLAEIEARLDAAGGE